VAIVVLANYPTIKNRGGFQEEQTQRVFFKKMLEEVLRVGLSTIGGQRVQVQGGGEDKNKMSRMQPATNGKDDHKRKERGVG